MKMGDGHSYMIMTKKMINLHMERYNYDMEGERERRSEKRNCKRNGRPKKGDMKM